MPDGKVTSQQLLIPYILYFAFAFACFLYGGLILSGILDPAESAQSPIQGLPVPLSVIFAAMSVSSVAAALIVGRVLEPPRESGPLTFLRKLQVRLIVQAAFMESIAILGLVGTFLGFTRVESLLFVGGGLIGLLGLFPGLQSRMDALKSMLRRAPEGSRT